MKINIKLPTGKVVSLEAEPTETVKEVKQRLQKYQNVSMDQQNLIFIGRRLEDKHDLQHYKIRQDSILYLFSKFETSFKVNVNIANKKTTTISIEETETIFSVKNKISNKESIPVNQQKLIFGFKELEDKKTVLDYNIKSDATINLELKGSKSATSGKSSNGKSSTCSIL